MDWTRLPVVVGGGQVTNRIDDPLAAPDPFELMALAARDAAGDVPGRNVLADLTHCFMVHSLSLRHNDPAGELARRLGAGGAETRCSGMGGSIPQWLVDRAAELVASGARPRVLIAGAEALATRRRAKKANVRLPWPATDGWPETWPPIETDLGVHPVERAHGLDQATAMYALVEAAVAHGAGHDPDTHRRAMGALMDRFNAVAAANPVSWFSTRRYADDIMAVTPENRIIFSPYPKYVNAVMDVDMGAAVIVTDAATARDWGLGADEVGYLCGWADAHDVWYLLQRPTLHHSPVLAQCARQALAAAGRNLAEVDAFDLYACFPSSVEVARDSIGLTSDDPRPITLTGGLPYHGGPGSNYVTHAIVNTLQWLREGKGDAVMVHGNGYYLTKHSVGVYSRRPPAVEPRPPEKLQERIDEESTELPVEPSAEGTGEVVAYTAPFDRDGQPGAALVLAELDGRRTVARADIPLTTQLLHSDAVGASVVVVHDDTGNLARPA